MMKRVFLAIDIPSTAREQAAGLITSLKKRFPGHRIGWERPEKLHLTLKFFGDVDDDQLVGIYEAIALTASEFEPFQFELSGTGLFPNSRRPRVLWLGVNGPGELRRLAACVDLHCEKIGFPAEKRPFKPHLTIARIREPERSASVAEEHLRSKFDPVKCEAKELVLYQSVLKQTGSEYTRLRSFPLGTS